MDKEKAIEVLNSLITINNDRIEGYETASAATDEDDLKSLFTRFITTSTKCKHELVQEVNALGGEEAEGTKVSGKFFRAWMNVKAALTGRDRKAILDSCEFGEDSAKETYDDALEDDDDDLTEEHHTMIQSQRSALQADHDYLRSLRDAVSKSS